jgi:hypothetical protein
MVNLFRDQELAVLLSLNFRKLLISLEDGVGFHRSSDFYTNSQLSMMTSGVVVMLMWSVCQRGRRRLGLAESYLIHRR